jgi:small-conductance mechanosensitive channel
MVAIRDFLVHRWVELVIPACVLAITLALGYLTRRILFPLLDGWAARTRSRLAPAVVDLLRRPFMIWVLILALHLATQSSALPGRATHWASNILLILWFLSLSIVASRLAGDLIRFYGAGIPGALTVTTLTQNLVQLGVVILALMVLLNQLGIQITAILTALGVGGLAVALALQDTLSNLFAGFYIAVAGQLRPGDYIKLNSGEEGYVSDISWRNTTIRALPNNLIIVPNSKLGQAVVTNYHLPEKRMGISVQVGVGYDSDPDQVEVLLLEEARKAFGELPGLLAKPEPFVRFDPGFGDSSLGFTLYCQVAEFVDQYLVRHELRKRILKRFRAEGVEIPFPTRTVYLQGSGGGGELGRGKDL